MGDEVEQIKERLDIVEVISSYLTVKKAGAYHKANCPFHNEKTPSFMISQERQTFKCFGCGEGGDIYSFIEKMEGIDFYNALKILADKAGVQLKSSVKYGDREYKADKKTRLFEVNDWAKKLFHKVLIDHPKAEHARQYLKKRGISDETIKNFEIGYAPDSWDLLTKFLKGKNYSVEEIVQAGVAVRKDSGDCYDRFRGRIMFPINNIMGLTIAFTSRVLKDSADVAKYLNSAESAVFSKGKTLYGLDKAKLALKELDLAILVEGNMDVISCHQAGFKNVVATSGTAITEDQLKILSRYSSVVAFAFDSDEAGETAMKKAVQIALRNDIASKVISLPVPFKDPDEAIKNDPKVWKKAVDGAKPSLEHWIDLLVKKNPDLGVLTKKKIAKEILPVIKMIYSDIEKEYYIKYLSKKLFISEKALVNVLEKTDKPEEKKREEEVKPAKLSLTEKILGLLWHDPSLLTKETSVLLGSVPVEKTDIFCSMIQKGTINKEKVPGPEAMILNQYLLMSLGDQLADEDIVKSEMHFLISRLRSEQRDHIKSEFAQKIQKAEESGDKDLVKKLLLEFSTLIK